MLFLDSLVLAAALAQGQPAADALSENVDDQSIVVTGEREERPLVETLRDLDIVESDKQYARWNDRPCLSYRGWGPEYQTVLSARLESILDRYFSDPSKAGRCKPNVEIIFADQPDAYLELIKDRAGRIYRQFPPQNRQNVENSSDAVRILAGVSRVNKDGRPTYKPGAVGAPPGLEDLSGLGEIIVQGSGVGDSKIGKMVRSDYVVALVIVDAPKSMGLGVPALADYISVRLLTGAQDGAPPGQDSVLSLFQENSDAGFRPKSLTDYDEALLAAFAEVPAAEFAARQRAALARNMRKQLENSASE
jgi:hypothetical protein